MSVGESVVKSITRILDLGIRPDWWKIPCMDRASAHQVNELISARTPHCCGIVILGLDAPTEQLAEGFKAFRGLSLVKGFAVGRTLFGQSAKAWLANDIDDAELVRGVAGKYKEMVEVWGRAMGAG